MTAPKNAAQIQGQGSVSADNLNTYVQWCTTAAVLRSFIGLPNMNVYLEGISAPNDGLQGYFMWQAVVANPDDNLNYIIPPGSAGGGWVRLSIGGNAVISPSTGNVAGNIVVMSNTTTGIQDSGVPVAGLPRISPAIGNVVGDLVVMSNTTTGFTDSGVSLPLTPAHGGKPTNRYTNYGTITGITTSSTTFVMTGNGGVWTITPTTTGRVRFNVVGDGFSGNSTPAAAKTYYGTGTAPVANVAVPGGAILGNTRATPLPDLSPAPVEFYYEVTGLTIGIPYWFDIAVAAPGAAGVGVGYNAVTIEEF